MSDWKPKNFEKRPVAVIGGGVLGRRIACIWASAGFPVRVRDYNAHQREGSLEYIKENVASYAEKTGIAPATDVQAFDGLADAVKDAWLVIEAIPERIDAKTDMFAELEKLAPADAILATNSSSYKSSAMTSKVSDETKKRILNMHYYSPPGCMLVELMTDGHTRPEYFPFLVEQSKRAATIPYVAGKESTGLIFNRIWAAVKREVLNVLAEGVSTPKEIDELWDEVFIKPKSAPCRLMDKVGLDTVAFIEQHYIHERNLPETPVKYLQDTYIKEKKLGNKSPLGGFFPPPDKKDGGKAIYVLDLGLWKDPTKSSTPGSILKYNLDGSNEQVVVPEQALPDGIAVDLEEKRLFWTNMGYPGKPDGSLHSCNLEGGDIQTLVAPGKINTPKQMALDRTTKTVYFSDREGMRVYQCGYDGSNLTELVIGGDVNAKDAADRDETHWCVGMCVSPKLGKLYWTQKGQPKSGRGRIFSADLALPAGKTAATRTDIEVVLADLPEPIDVEIDEASQTLYWTDRGELPFGNTLNKVQLDTKGAKVAEGQKFSVLARNFHEAIGLSLDLPEKHIYVADLGGGLYRTNLDGSDKKVLVSDVNRTFTGVVVF